MNERVSSSRLTDHRVNFLIFRSAKKPNTNYIQMSPLNYTFLLPPISLLIVQALKNVVRLGHSLSPSPASDQTHGSHSFPIYELIPWS